MKRLMWQFEWQDIEFRKLGVKLKFFNRASADFYSTFYKELFYRYAGYDDLPKNWRDEKYKTAKSIAQFLKGKKKIMSVGCGLGYIEKCLVELKPRCHIDAYDFSMDASLWLHSVEGIRVIQELEKGDKYDFIYCTQLLYALTDKEIYDFAVFLRSVLDNNAVFLTVDTSVDNRENGIATTLKVRIKQEINFFFRPVYYFLRQKHKAQFWGWTRDNSALIRIFREAGFDVDNSFSAVGQSFLVFRIPQSRDL